MSLTIPADPFAALVRELDLQLIHLKQMLALAGEEHRDLFTGNIARLDAISAEQLVQLHALELYTAQRAACLAELGFSADASGLAACAAAARSRGGKLITAWKRVADALGDLRDLNEENTTLLRARLTEVDGPHSPLAEPVRLERG